MHALYPGLTSSGFVQPDLSLYGQLLCFRSSKNYTIISLYISTGIVAVENRGCSLNHCIVEGDRLDEKISNCKETERSFNVSAIRRGSFVLNLMIQIT